MSETVEVPFEGQAGDKATLLLAAAEELDLPASVVRTTAGAFLVPAEVEAKAFGSRKSGDGDGSGNRRGKKAAAKKSASDDKKEQE